MISALRDNGAEIHPEIAERLLRVPARALDQTTSAPPVEVLEAKEEAQRKALLKLAEQQNNDWIDREGEKLDAYAEDLEKAFEIEVKAFEAEIRVAKKALRGSNLSMDDKVAEKRRIGGLEAKRDKMKAEFFDRRATLRARPDSGKPQHATRR